MVDKDKALETLDDWMRSFVRVAKVALRTEPQLLEKLGIPTRSNRTAAQRGAGEKTSTTRRTKRNAKPGVVSEE